MQLAIISIESLTCFPTFYYLYNKQVQKQPFPQSDIIQVRSLRTLPQPLQELALKRHAISYPGSCGCVVLRQK